jgi:hypothetical protein
MPGTNSPGRRSRTAHPFVAPREFADDSPPVRVHHLPIGPGGPLLSCRNGGVPCQGVSLRPLPPLSAVCSSFPAAPDRRRTRRRSVNRTVSPAGSPGRQRNLRPGSTIRDLGLAGVSCRSPSATAGTTTSSIAPRWSRPTVRSRPWRRRRRGSWTSSVRGSRTNAGTSSRRSTTRGWRRHQSRFACARTAVATTRATPSPSGSRLRDPRPPCRPRSRRTWSKRSRASRTRRPSAAPRRPWRSGWRP